MTGTGSVQVRPGAAPDRMARLSACRRIRVVRWSSENRSASAAGSDAFCSSESISRSWRCSSDWFRRARLTNTWRRPLRRPDSPVAAAIVVRCSRLMAVAAWSISMLRVRGQDGISSVRPASWPSRSRCMACGSCSSASRRAVPARSARSRDSCRANVPISTTAPMITTRPPPPSRIISATCAWVMLDRWSSRPVPNTTASAHSTTRQATGRATVAMKVNRIDRRAGRGCCGAAELDTAIRSLLDRLRAGPPRPPPLPVGDPSCAIKQPLSWSFVELPGR